jgi:hypothetical protein
MTFSYGDTWGISSVVDSSMDTSDSSGAPNWDNAKHLSYTPQEREKSKKFWIKNQHNIALSNSTWCLNHKYATLTDYLAVTRWRRLCYIEHICVTPTPRPASHMSYVKVLRVTYAPSIFLFLYNINGRKLGLIKLQITILNVLLIITMTSMPLPVYDSSASLIDSRPRPL